MADHDQTKSGPTPEEAARATAVLTQALRSPVPRFYANSFVNAITDADVMTIFQANGQSICIMNLNYTVAKAYMSALGTAIKAYEDKLKTQVPVIELTSVGSPSHPVKVGP